MSDLRAHHRSNYRTLVTVLRDDENNQPAPQVFKAWTEDISASGMQLVCNEELPDGRLYVRILLPALEDKIVACTVVRNGRREPTGLLPNSGPRYVYGVRFDSVQSSEKFESACGRPPQLLCRDWSLPETSRTEIPPPVASTVAAD